jgi:hypothetical protein
MKLFAAALFGAAALATSAFAAPADVRVSIGPQLQARAHDYGQRDLNDLASTLQRDVERALSRSGALQDAERVDLTIVAATPNRPTFQQLSNRPGLSMQSFGIGGATIEGAVRLTDGSVRPIRYRWYESDIRFARHHGTWEDAERAFDMFARSLARGE